MLKNLLTPEVQKFIRDHEHDDEHQVVLRQKEIAGVASSIIADQIAGKRKAKDKLPTYYNTSNIIYPPGINLEQSSSEQTAKFKSTLLSLFLRKTAQGRSPGQAVDLTTGFGTDAYFLSQLFSQLHCIEPNINLLEIARHNHIQLGAQNIQYHNTSAEIFLDQLDNPVELVFIDPSRRNENRKIFTFSDSTPNIIILQKTIFEKTDLLLIKASPLLDIKLGIKELSFVKKVFVVSVENEVKELLFLCEKDFSDEPYIEAVNFAKPGMAESFDFLFSQETNLQIEFADPLTYLYEPNASLLKAGAFRLIAKRFNLFKIHASTHLYTSNSFIDTFPGRIFKIDALTKPDPKELSRFFPEGKANISTRNYPLSVEELKKKTGIRDGGDKYLLGFSGLNKRFVCVARRLK